MSIQKINSPSFNGIRKVVSLILPTRLKNLESISMSIQRGICTSVKADTYAPTKKAKPSSLIKMTQFFNKDRLVGTHYEFVNGNYSGNRTFADGTKISYSATNMGNGLFVAGTRISNDKIGLIGGKISHDGYDKKGRPAVPTLKLIKKLMDPKDTIDITGKDF